MELKNKKIGFLGDSITYGVGTSNAENEYKGYRFPDLIAKKCGAIAYNYGVSGTRIAMQRDPDPNSAYEERFLLRAVKMEEDLDVIVIFGGTNDFGHGNAPIGDFSDRSEETFYGALHVLLTTVIKKYPKSVVVFLTPLHRLNEYSLINANGIRREPLVAYVDAIKEVCRYYSVPVLDLYSQSGMQPEIDVIRELYMPDGLHPSDLGATKISDMVVAFLENYII